MKTYKIKIEVEVPALGPESAQAMARKYKEAVGRLVLRPRSSGILPTRIVEVKEKGATS
jgi:hypothetical protein